METGAGQNLTHLRAKSTFCVIVFASTLFFPIISTICAVTVALFTWRWRPVPYDPDVPPKSRYSGTLKPPQHEMDIEDICAHCRDEFVEPLELPCGHVFCRGCIRSLIEYEQTRCPLCNRLQFTMLEPWAVLFVRLGSASTAVAIVVQAFAIIVDAYWPGATRVNPRPALNLINIFQMSSVVVLVAAMEYGLGDHWIAELALPVTTTFVWLAYSAYFAAYTSILLQLRFWDWSLFNVLRFLG
ncbi:hypothetical protein M409DRAFT_25856 [Zasmidium cellare ATCC 36951]|uniref:RING-type E3 ubiquitin transferase n=1 Tax=Zasmidium cellare ATCC 36951 TaxID=1080233 RepID=A0A6A6CBS9_ZASCE|nr:uncharacterized protein M409DRAFT_25856 [Zasmidium cellare ATCC 36951]KAF2163668.1 hypothetical protein M409DRAFT_25856 [Zasmidium cellare ATCC 36951]